MYFAHCWLNSCCTFHVETSSSRELDVIRQQQQAADLSALSLSRPQTELTFVKDFLFVSHQHCSAERRLLLCIIEAGMRRLNSDALSLITNGPLGLI